MNKYYKFILVFLIISMLFNYGSYFLIMEGKAEVEKYYSVAGKLDLSSWQDEETIIQLRGQWDYYDQQMLSEINDKNSSTQVEIPQNIKLNNTGDFKGYGTYTLLVSGLKANHGYGIYSGSQVTAFNLYNNGLLVVSNGNVSEDQQRHISQWKPKSGTVYTNDKGELALAMEISNYEYLDGPFWGSLELSGTDTIFTSHSSRLLIDTIMVFAFFMIALLLLIIFIFFKLERSLLYFALFIIDMGVRLMVTSSRPIMHYLGGISWDVMVRLEYFTGYMLLPLMFLFVLSIVKVSWIRIAEKSFIAIVVLITSLTVLFDHELYSSLLNPYLMISSVGLLAAMGLIFYRFRRDGFVMAIMVIVFSNFLLALGYQMFGSHVSYTPVAMMNAVFGLTILSLMDFIKEIRQNERMAISAMIDPLTGLYNRHYYEAFSEEHFGKDSSQNQYIMFCDLDGFKKINDQYGHNEGDFALQIVSQRLRNVLRANDFIIRYGGDEFILLIHADNVTQVEIVAQRIIQSMKERIVSNKHEHFIGVSIGIACCHDKDNYNMDHYVKRSDEAMYQAKASGGNGYIIVN